MNNQDTGAARDYHEATKLTYINLRNKPPLYKSYTGLPVIPLPSLEESGRAGPQAPTLEAVAGIGKAAGAHLDLATLAQLLFLSAGLIRKSVVPAAGEVHYRAAASAGALYPVEVYLVCQDVPSSRLSEGGNTPASRSPEEIPPDPPLLKGGTGGFLEAGVYHFSPADFSLRQLRQGDYRSALARAAGGDQRIAHAPATLVFTIVFWRSAWKYRARSYRYCLWDCGTILANLLAAASATGTTARVVAGFVDSQVDSLLGIDGKQEATVCLVPVGEGDASRPPQGASNATLRPLVTGAAGTPENVIDYPEIRQMHAATCLGTEEEVLAWRDAALAGTGSTSAPPPRGVVDEGLTHVSAYPLQPVEESGITSGALGGVILGRGSTRRFARQPIPYARLGAMLDAAARPLPADFLDTGQESLVDIYAIASAVDGLPSGAYVFNRGQRRVDLLKEGDFREEAGHLCFEQALGADASAVVFLMADLERILSSYGNRGYRAAQLEAGMLGGRLYLCVHSLGLGASGITFYDDDVTDFFSPHAAGKSTMFVVTLGVTARENRVRPFRSRVGVMLDALARGAR